MTIKLYDKDAYQTIFEAQVITCTKRENDYDIVLDQTLFFPEEGGQTCDHGTLNDVEVIDVKRCELALKRGINGPRRNSQRLRLLAVDVQIKLRSIGIVC